MTEPLHIIPAHADRDSLFRCEWGPWPSCTLAYKACLRRQAATYRKPGPHGRKLPALPVYPTCHDECAVGQLVSARFGPEKTLVLAHSGTGRLQVYRPTAAEEQTMPTVKLTKACGVKGCPGRISEHNKSGICTACSRRKFSLGDEWRPSGRSGLVRQGKAQLDPTMLSDEDLAACVREARERKTRIEREAAERVQHLEAALAGSLLPAQTKRETGT